MRIDGAEGEEKLERKLTLFDSVMIVVTGIVGSSIFIVPADVLRALPNPAVALLLWVAAGGITLMAGLACAELGGMYPEAGGQYVFIREAYGRFAAFLYGWVLFTACNSGALAAMAISTAIFFGRAFPQFAADQVVFALNIFGWHGAITRGTLFAIASVVVLTVVNLLSVKVAAWLQNITALSYLTALGLIVVLGLVFGHGSWSHFSPPADAGAASVTLGGLGVGMIALFWCYDGWEFLTWVGGEIKNPSRNLPLGLIIGIVLVIVTYLLANAVFLYALPPVKLAQQTALADAAMTALFSHDAGRWVSLFIASISFGAGSVVVLGGARIYYRMARDGTFFRRMGDVHPRWRTPWTALIAQCIWVIVLILSGRYEQLYTCFIFMMTLTTALTVGALFVLRRTQPERERPYRCTGYPWLPGAYLAVATGFVVSTLAARPMESLAGLGMASLGLPLYFYWRLTARAGVESAHQR
ncbi:MAG TPA: amino acid permease [Steroidobacteraceae bacterium]|jgi:APA family basic amino acid/polyamine antiporter|nr:amino acid permease [Steroidobacteraceae bacterium]